MQSLASCCSGSTWQAVASRQRVHQHSNYPHGCHVSCAGIATATQCRCDGDLSRLQPRHAGERNGSLPAPPGSCHAAAEPPLPHWPLAHFVQPGQEQENMPYFCPPLTALVHRTQMVYVAHMNSTRPGHMCRWLPVDDHAPWGQPLQSCVSFTCSSQYIP